MVNNHQNVYPENMKAAEDDTQMTHVVGHLYTELHLYLLHTSQAYHEIHKTLTTR